MTEELQLNDGAEITPEMMNNPEMMPEGIVNQETLMAGVSGLETGIDIYSEQEFIDGFRGVFNAGGDITGIQSLKIDLENTKDRVGSERAAVRLYNACQKYNWLNFLINKKSGVFADVVIIASFAIAKGQAVAVEVGYTPKFKLWEKVKKWLRIPKKETA